MATQPSIPNVTDTKKFATVNSVTFNIETGLFVLQTQITALQLKALRATPITLIPAGVQIGEAIICDRIHLSYNFVTTAYTLNAGTLKVFYGPVANAHALTVDLATSFLTAAASRKIIGVNPLVIGSDTFTNTTLQPIIIANDGAAEYTLGDATLTVTIEYSKTTP